MNLETLIYLLQEDLRIHGNVEVLIEHDTYVKEIENVRSPHKYDSFKAVLLSAAA